MNPEKAALIVLMPLTIIVGFFLLDYSRPELSLLFCLLGLFDAGILMRDEENWKIGAIFLFLIFAVAAIRTFAGG